MAYDVHSTEGRLRGIGLILEDESLATSCKEKVHGWRRIESDQEAAW